MKTETYTTPPGHSNAVQPGQTTSISFIPIEQQQYNKIAWYAAEKRIYQNFPSGPLSQFPHIGLNPETLIAPNLPANVLYKPAPSERESRIPYAMVMAQPTLETLENIFRLLAWKTGNPRLSCIVAIEESSFLDGSHFLKYFYSDWLQENKTVFHEFKITSARTYSAPDGSYEIFCLRLDADDKSLYRVPLIHVTCRLDISAIVPLKYIIREINAFNDKANFDFIPGFAIPDYITPAIPFFHCANGLESNAILAAMLRLMDPQDPSSLTEIYCDLLRDRTAAIELSFDQFLLLVEFAKEFYKEWHQPPTLSPWDGLVGV